MTRDDYVLEAVLGVVKLSLSTKIREVRDGVKKRASKKNLRFRLAKRSEAVQECALSEAPVRRGGSGPLSRAGRESETSKRIFIGFARRPFGLRPETPFANLKKIYKLT